MTEEKEAEWTDEEIQALVEDAKNFYRCGGTILVSEWLGMDTRTKSVFIKASHEMGIEKTVLDATAKSGPEGLLRVMAEHDGGDRLVAFNLKGAITRYISRRKSS